MKIFNTTLLTAALLVLSQSALAQHGHSDVEFSYSGGMIDIEFGSEGNVYEAEFPTGAPGEQETDDPGFGSEAEEGLGVLPGDEIDYLILAPLTYHDGTNFAPVPGGASITIGDNPSGGLTVDASTSGPVSGTGIIDIAVENDPVNYPGIGDIHNHIDFTLNPLSLDTPEYGAYGLLMQLTTDAVGIANSEPFYIVFNFGLEEEIFEGAVEAFAEQVPEPNAALLLVLASTVLVAKRR